MYRPILTILIAFLPLSAFAQVQVYREEVCRVCRINCYRIGVRVGETYCEQRTDTFKGKLEQVRQHREALRASGGDPSSIASIPSSMGTGDTLRASAPEALPTERVRMIRALDGSTIKVIRQDGKIAVIRLLGIRTPEKQIPEKVYYCEGEESFKELSSLLTNPLITVRRGTSQDRTPAGEFLRYAEVNGKDIGALMIFRGFAVASSYSHPYRSSYATLQERAKSERKGLWGEVCANLQ